MVSLQADEKHASHLLQDMHNNKSMHNLSTAHDHVPEHSRLAAARLGLH